MDKLNSVLKTESSHYSIHNKYSHNKYRAKWVEEVKESSFFTKSSLKETVKYLFENCYVQLGNKVFRQPVGIPGEYDRATFFANLFIYHCENSWITKTKRIYLSCARRFTDVFRFIDDLAVFRLLMMVVNKVTRYITTST